MNGLLLLVSRFALGLCLSATFQLTLSAVRHRSVCDKPFKPHQGFALSVSKFNASMSSIIRFYFNE